MKLLKLLLFFGFFVGSLGMNAQIEKTITPSGAIKFKGIIMHKGDAAPKALMVADVPKEQVIKDCQFFGGDTLNGFDFKAAEKGAHMQNAKMYMEYKAYMHQQQAAFVKQKYNIQTLPGEIVNRNGAPHTLASACSNLDFENGDFSSWTITYGINQNSNGALTVAGTTPVYDINQNIYDCWPANQITAAYGNDPVSALPGLDPAGGSYSARLGGYFFNEAQGYDGGYCGNQLSATYADGEIFSQSFVVSAANALVSFDYQIVLNDGAHANGSQPYFHAIITNAGGTVLSTCTDYSVQVNGGGGVPPGFVNNGWVNGNDNSPIYNGVWVSNSINLTPYIGQTIILKFSAAGCTLGGHWAYAYIDATCGPAALIVSNPSPCAGGTSVLTAPAVYQGAYSWSGPGIVGSTTSQNVTVNATGTYFCTITPIQGAGCAYTLSQSITFTPPPTVSFGTGSQTVCSGAAVSGESFTSSPAGGTFAWTNNNTNIGIGASGSGNIAGYTAPGVASQQIGTISVTPTVAGCVGTPSTFNITINPIPTVSSAPGAQAVCSGAAVAGEGFTSTPAGGTFAWTNNNTNIGIGASGSGNIAGYTAPVVASQQVGTISVTPTLNGCVGTPGTFNITINPIPTVSSAPGAQAVCSGAAVAGEGFTSIPAGGTFAWTNNNTNIGIGASGSGNIAGYTAPGVASQQIGTISVTPTVAGCVGTPSTFNITINPKPTVSSAPGAQAVCSGAAVAGEGFTSTPAGGTFAWTNNNTNIGIGASGSGNIAGYTAPVVASQQVGTISVTPTLNGCVGTPGTFNITINPIPTVSSAPGAQAVCSGAAVAGEGFTSIPAGGTFAWTNNNTNIGIGASGSGNIAGYVAPVVASQQVGTISVTPTLNGCTGNPGTFNITINPLPIISVVATNTAICSGGGSSTLTASGASTYTWTPAATLAPATGSVVTATPIATTNYTVTGTDANNCVNKNTISITVNPTPTVSIVGGGGNSQTVCGGGLANATVNGITFTSTPSGSVNWTNSNTGIGVAASGSGNIASYPAPAVTTQTVGVITASSTVAGCTSTNATQLNYTITINPIPGETGGTITPAGCGMNNGTIIGAAGTGGSTYSYEWNNTGGFVASSSYTNAAGTYPLQIKDNVTGCIYSQNFTIPNLGAPPAPTVTASATSVCVGGTVTLTAPTVAGTTYSWTPITGAPGTGDTFTITVPSAPNPFTIGVTATSGGCTSAAATTSITVNPLPTPAISSSTSQICQGSSTTLSVTPTGAYSYQWGNSSGIIAGATSNTLSVNAPDTYSVTVTDNTTNCSASTSANGTITVNPLPTIDTTGVIVTQTSCTVATGGITNINITGAATITYTWTSGSAVGPEVSNGAGASATLSNAGAGVYCLNVTDGNSCQASFCSITITNAGAPSTPVLTAAGNDTTYCQGDPMQTLTVTVASSGTVTPTINWYSDAGLTTVIAANTNTYTPSGIPVGTPTTIYVAATVNGCTSISRPITITINPTPPVPVLTAPTGTNNAFCQGSPVPLTVNSGTSTAVWYSNNTVVNVGSTFNPPANTPAGTYTFSVIDSIAVAGGCVNASQSANTVTLTLVVNPTPPAPVLTAPTGVNNAFCQGSPVPLTVNSGTSTAVWYSNNTVVNVGSTFNPPANTPAGTYTFSIIDSIAVAGGCVNASQSANTVTLTLVVNPTPPAPVLTAPTGVNNAFCQGSPVPLTVNSGTSTAVWYSNNTVVNVGSTFNPPANTPAGTYTFSVIDSIAVAGGCVNASQSANTVTLTLVVNPTPPAPVLTAPTGTNNAFCQGSPVPLTVNSGTSTAVWYSNNTVVNVGSTFNPPANTPAGTYTYSVIDSIAVAGGCVNASQSANTVTLTLVVNPTPPAPVLTAPTGTNNAFCQGSPVPLTVNSGAAPSTAVWYSNNTVVNVGSTFNPPANTPAGTYTFSIIDSIAVAGGCVNASQLANTVTLTLVVNPTPTINVSGASLDTARCGQTTGGVSNLSINNVSGGTPGYHFQWYSGVQPIAGATSPVLSGQPAGNYNLVVTDTNGCVANVNGGSLTFTVPASAAIHAQATTNPNPATGTIPLAVTFSNTSTGANSYNWSLGDGNSSTAISPTNTYTNVGTYTVVLAAINGTCTDTFRITVIANIATTIIIPNIFSPNGDGINDEFFIPNTGMSSLNCDIFNRWGQLLHSITAPNQGWDGITPNGDKAPDGTYMYILQAQGLDGKTYKQQGTVTLVR